MDEQSEVITRVSVSPGKNLEDNDWPDHGKVWLTVIWALGRPLKLTMNTSIEDSSISYGYVKVEQNKRHYQRFSKRRIHFFENKFREDGQDLCITFSPNELHRKLPTWVLFKSSPFMIKIQRNKSCKSFRVIDFYPSHCEFDPDFIDDNN